MLAALLTVLLAAPTPRQGHEILYADEIQAYLRADAAHPPARGGILFVGSSIFRQWTTVPQDMAPLPTFNRAFGGARTWEVLHYADRVVLPYRPRVIVYYCGSNDVNAGEPAEAIAGRVAEFTHLVGEALPQTRVAIVSIIRAPQKRDQLLEVVDRANALMREACGRDRRLTYVDVNPALEDAKGEPLAALYQSDRLHLLPAAYERMTGVVRPVVERLWAAVQPRPAPMAVYPVSGFERMRPDDPPVLPGKAVIKAARNEVEPFQIAVRAGAGGLRGVTVTASDLSAGRGRTIPRRNLTLYREHYVEVGKPSPRSVEGTGWYPDALIPFASPETGAPLKGGRFVGAPFDVPAERNQPIWIEVHVPKGQTPGVYRGSLTVTAEGVKPVRVPVELTVWPFELPDTPSMRSDFGGLDSRVAEAFGMKAGSPEFKPVERRFAAAMAAHRLCPPIPWYLYPRTNADGSIDPAATHAALKEWIDTFHVTGFALRLIGDDPAGKDRERATRHLQAMYAYLKAHGWEKMAYVYVLDEPNDAAAYEEVRRRAKLIHEAQPGIKVLCTEQPTSQDPAWGTLVGAVDIWVPLWPLLEEKAGAERLAAGEELWSYTALCQGGKGQETPFWEIDFPLLNYRVPMWQSYRYGMAGLLYWSTVYWAKAGNVWTNPLTYEQYNGEGSLFYPGSAVGYDGPVASMRLKQLREGLEDYEYLRLLERLGGKEDAARLARKIGASWTRWETIPAKLYAAREELAAFIVERSKAAPKPARAGRSQP